MLIQEVIWCRQFSSLALLMVRACFALLTNSISWVSSPSRREAAAQPRCYQARPSMPRSATK